MKPHLAYPILTIVLLLILAGIYPSHANAVVSFMSSLADAASGKLSADDLVRQSFWAIGGLIVLFAATGAAVTNWGR